MRKRIITSVAEESHTISMPEFEALVLNLSMETFDFKSIPGAFLGIVQRVLSAMNMVKKFSATDKLHGLNTDQKKFLEVVNGMPYVALSEVKASLPEGFSHHATYLDYINAIAIGVDHVKDIQKNLVTPYSLFLAKYISDDKFPESLFDDKEEMLALDKTRDSIQAGFRPFFERNSYKSAGKVKHVIQRNSDWPTLFVEINKQIKVIDSVDRKTILKQIDECTGYIEIILKKFRTNPDKKVSRESAARLSNHAYTIARELELFSNLYYRLLTLKNAVDQTTEFIVSSLSTKA